MEPSIQQASPQLLPIGPAAQAQPPGLAFLLHDSQLEQDCSIIIWSKQCCMLWYCEHASDMARNSGFVGLCSTLELRLQGILPCCPCQERGSLILHCHSPNLGRSIAACEIPCWSLKLFMTCRECWRCCDILASWFGAKAVAFCHPFRNSHPILPREICTDSRAAMFRRQQSWRSCLQRRSKLRWRVKGFFNYGLSVRRNKSRKECRTW